MASHQRFACFFPINGRNTFGLGVSEDKKMLSLEHTHPPASFAVHGERFKVQAEIKRQWFNALMRKK